MMTMKNVNEKIRDLIEQGFTQKALSEAIGVSQPTISDLANGVQKDIGIEKGGRKIDALHALHCSKAA
jgi:predicted XRE-type DNA-binding protein